MVLLQILVNILLFKEKSFLGDYAINYWLKR